MTDIEIFLRLAVALAVGLLIGLERGRSERTTPEAVNRRITGMRTFGLIGLLGAICALLAEEIHLLFLGFSFLGFVVLMTTFHVIAAESDHDYGITTIIASFITFALGAVAMIGYTNVTAAVAVVMTIILGMKPILHRVEERFERIEFDATMKLLLISVVVLPVLPNKGFGPWNALNPYTIWWMVVLIAGISYIGYFGIKIAGQKRGLLVTGFLGGLASSTAVTLNYSRLGRENRQLSPIVSASILVAAGIMYPRVLLISGIVSPNVALKMIIPLVTMTVVCLVSAGLLSRSYVSDIPETEQPLRNPFELKVALQLAAILALVMFLARGFQEWLGATGIYLLAAFSGITDVDAINLALSGMASNNEIFPDIAARAIIVACMVNTFAKGLLATIIGGKKLFLYVGITLLIAILLGLAIIFSAG